MLLILICYTYLLYQLTSDFLEMIQVHINTIDFTNYSNIKFLNIQILEDLAVKDKEKVLLKDVKHRSWLSEYKKLVARAT